MQTNRCIDSDNDFIYKDVVIIGNGPSGISLSYMLAGNWPYYNGEPHPNDEMLSARLHYTFSSHACPDSEGATASGTSNHEDGDDDRRKTSRRCCSAGHHRKWKRGIPLAHSNRDTLECLSAGVEGRTGGRPLSLLMDQLQHPGVDIGMDVPPLLTWKSAEHEPDHKIIDHVVLGKGPPGGAWHSLDQNVLTISLCRWMSLPNLDLRQWEQLDEADKHQSSFGEERSDQEKITTFRNATRVSIGTVAAYYKDYVVRQGLQQYFRCGVTVTSVRPVVGVSQDDDKEYGWQVDGYENESKKCFRYRCKKVVLASGTTDSSNRLGIPGETSQSWVTHDLSDLENKLDELLPYSNGHSGIMDLDKSKSHPKIDPVLVVGAGLSAADAIMATRFRGISVLHAFRDASSDLDDPKKSHNSDIKLSNTGFIKLQYLPDSVYPEYYKVYEMMADGGRNYPLYKALPNHSLVSLNVNPKKPRAQTERKVTLCNAEDQLVTYRVSIVAILIGFKPDLSYLENNGLGLGKDPDKYIDSKSNPVVVDDITYEVQNAPRVGLYALGPLVGDNFVRFILGGAFGAFTHILRSST